MLCPTSRLSARKIFKKNEINLEYINYACACSAPHPPRPRCPSLPSATTRPLPTTPHASAIFLSALQPFSAPLLLCHLSSSAFGHAPSRALRCRLPRSSVRSPLIPRLHFSFFLQIPTPYSIALCRSTLRILTVHCHCAYGPHLVTPFSFFSFLPSLRPPSLFF